MKIPTDMFTDLQKQATAIAVRFGHTLRMPWILDTPHPNEHMVRCEKCDGRVIIAPRSLNKVPIRGEATAFYCEPPKKEDVTPITRAWLSMVCHQSSCGMHIHYQAGSVFRCVCGVEYVG